MELHRAVLRAGRQHHAVVHPTEGEREDDDAIFWVSPRREAREAAPPCMSDAERDAPQRTAVPARGRRVRIRDEARPCAEVGPLRELDYIE